MAGPSGQDGCRAQCNNIKMAGKVYAARRRLCEKMAGKSKDGGCVKKRWPLRAM
jgi:hypothetical protein